METRTRLRRRERPSSPEGPGGTRRAAARRLCLLLAALAPACASPARSPAAGRLALEKQEPGLTEARPRLVQRREFWQEYQVEIRTELERAWVPPGEPIRLRLCIHNGGVTRLKLPMTRRVGLWPFSRRESGMVYYDLSRLRLSVRDGEQRTVQRLTRSGMEDLLVEPGAEAVLTLELPAPAAPGDYERWTIEPVLYPLAVQFAGQPERLVALPFPAVEAHVAPAEVVAALGIGDWQLLERSLRQEPGAILGAAILLAGLDPIRVVDWLVGRLPGPDRACTVALLMALEHVTGVNLGLQVEAWRSWWSSESGARWAMEQRLTRRSLSR